MKVRIEFEVTRGLLIAAICDYWDLVGLPLVRSRNAVMCHVRSYLERRGDVNCGSFDDIADEDYRKAEGIVDDLFPEFQVVK